MIMLLTCTSISVMAADTLNDTADQDEKMTIGVSVYNLNDAEVRAFRNYFENYVGMAFDGSAGIDHGIWFRSDVDRYRSGAGHRRQLDLLREATAQVFQGGG